MTTTTNKTEYVYFWSIKDKDFSCFSQWYPTEFEEDGILFNCSEQYMMAHKALLFSDITIYDKIMKTSSPKQMKSLGRKIKNFDHKIWEKERYSIVLNGNMLKFGSNTDILDILQSTGDSIIAEASPYDKIWGIGMKKRKGLVRKDWNGLNLLGYVLMEVRTSI
jgi:ribA/ribD-fused uncharacterized protein